MVQPKLCDLSFPELVATWVPTLKLPGLQTLPTYHLGRHVALPPATWQICPGRLSLDGGAWGVREGGKVLVCVVSVDLGKPSLASLLLAHCRAAITTLGTGSWLYHFPGV